MVLILFPNIFIPKLFEWKHPGWADPLGTKAGGLSTKLGAHVRRPPRHWSAVPLGIHSAAILHLLAIPMNISSIIWQGSKSAIFCFMHLQRRSFRGSLTPLSDFRVVAEICPDLFRFLQCSHDPGCSYPQPLIIWSKMPRVGAQPLKGSPALCHVKTCSGKMGKPFLGIPSFWFQCRPTATTQKAGFNLSIQPTMKLVIEPASAILLHSLMPALAFQWAILE